MKTTSKEQFKKALIEFFERESHMTLTQAKQKIKDQMKDDEFDNSIKARNVRVFYSANKNYAEGGKGFYISKTGFHNNSIIKL